MSSYDEDELLLFRKKLFLTIGAILAVIIAWRIRNVLILIFIAAVLAGAIAPAVRRVQVLVRRYMHRRIRRGMAVLMVFIPFAALLVLLGVLTIPRLLAQSEQLATQLPLLIEKKLEVLPDVVDVKAIEGSIRGWLAHFPLFAYLRSAATVVSSAVAVLFMVAYMLADAERLRNLFLLFFPAHQRARRQRTSRRVGRRLSSWLGGQLTLAAIVGAATFVALTALRVPYAVPLAIIAAIGEMVPVIGPIVGAVPALTVALFLSDWQFWGVLIVSILIQQFENYLLVPRIMGKKVSVSPLAVFIAFMIGLSLLGIIGAIMAVPAVAIVQIVFEEGFLLERERRRDRGRTGVVISEDGE